MTQMTHTRQTRKLLSWAVGCVVFLRFLCAGVTSANPFEDTVQILENRTAFHWGRDCLVWVVHYSEDLVGPWVESEAGRVGMTDTERDQFKAGFISDLSIGEAEPILVTVHSFGAKPVSFAPLSEKIALVTTRGERFKPTKYDNVLDQPLSGVVQGLVFFPKQSTQDFAIAMSGLGVYDERIFSFSSETPEFSGQAGQSDAVSALPEEDDAKVIVMEFPPASAAENNNAEKPKTPARREPRATERPTPPPSPEPVQTAEPAQAPVQARPEPVQPTAAAAAGPEIIVLEPDAASADKEPAGEDMPAAAYSSREQTLKTFLDHWAKLDTEAMYPMLSDSSRKLFSKETFDAELKKSPDFRSALKDGYTIDWLGTERAKVVTIKRILFIRTLLSRTLGVAREGSAWKIVW